MTGMKRKHVILICFPVFGEYIPMLEFAKRIDPMHDVTIVISASKYHDIRERNLLPPKNIRLFPLVDGVENNIDTELDVKLLADMIKSMGPYHIAFAESLRISGEPDGPTKRIDIPPIDGAFVAFDMCDAIQVFHRRKLPVYAFSTFSGSLMASWSKVDESTPVMPDDTFFNGSASHIADYVPVESTVKWVLEANNAVGLVRGIVINSFEALEPEVRKSFTEIPKTLNIPIKFIGPLLPPTTPEKEASCDALKSRVVDWLDGHQEGVVYLSFGSITVPSSEQLKEIAEGLLALRKPFIWALRQFQQVHLPESFVRWSEDNFTLESPYLILPWAPQKTILNHKSTRVFVSHCGWNSALEAVSYGVPIVGWPMFLDQHANAALLSRLGAGITIPRTGLKSVQTVLAKEIREIIEKVGGWDGNGEDRKCLEKAAELAKKAAAAISDDGDSTQAFRDLMSSF